MSCCCLFPGDYFPRQACNASFYLTAVALPSVRRLSAERAHRPSLVPSKYYFPLTRPCAQLFLTPHPRIASCFICGDTACSWFKRVYISAPPLSASPVLRPAPLLPPSFVPTIIATPLPLVVCLSVVVVFCLSSLSVLSIRCMRFVTLSVARLPLIRYISPRPFFLTGISFRPGSW